MFLRSEEVDSCQGEVGSREGWAKVQGPSDVGTNNIPWEYTADLQPPVNQGHPFRLVFLGYMGGKRSGYKNSHFKLMICCWMMKNHLFKCKGDFVHV